MAAADIIIPLIVCLALGILILPVAGIRLPWVVACRYELWPSVILVIVGTMLFRLHAPQGPTDTIGYATVVTLSWIFALNAVLAVSKMSVYERIVVAAWFPYVTWLTLEVLRYSYMTRVWSDR